MQLRCELNQLATWDLVRMLQRGHLTLAGQHGGPDWSIDTRAQLFDSLERRWPIGTLLAWNPADDWWQRWYLLDGHRRAAALSELAADAVDLVRDLGSVQPRYLPATACSGVCLPVNAMLSTLRFLPAVAGLPADVLAVAEHAASPITNTLFAVTTVTGGTAQQVAALCQRLLPGRVTTTTLQQILTRDAADPYRPRG